MRGLHWLYQTDPVLDAERLAERLQLAWDGNLIRGDEQWGKVHVVRLIMQFEVEFRIGERPGQISMIHRVTSSDEVRQRSQERLEAALQSLLPH
jgi:hypothetical protein